MFDDEGKGRRRPSTLATAAWFEAYLLERYAPVDVVAGPVLLLNSSLMR